ncbi:MAG TPA: hypothetical protein VKB19_05465 [Pedobacter sp.]|nr:hypothetical protein [Pedobacter sp.]
MATLKGKFFRGSVGNTVMKKYRGKQVLSIMPHFMMEHMTEGSKKSSKTFGKASSLAASVRLSLANIITPNYDGTMVYRLNTDVLSTLNLAKNAADQTYHYTGDSFKNLMGFEFNADSVMRNYFYAVPKMIVDGNVLQVNFPEMSVPEQLKFPNQAKVSEGWCRLLINATMIDLASFNAEICTPQFMDIPYVFPTSVMPEHSFEFMVQPGKLCVVAFSLQYFTQTFAGPFFLNSKQLNPSAILYAALIP